MRPLTEATTLSGSWARLYNGGSYSRFYLPPVDVVYYGNSGSAIRNHPSTIFRNLSLQQKPGVAFGKRGDFIDAHLLRQGFVSTVEGSRAADYSSNISLSSEALNKLHAHHGFLTPHHTARTAQAVSIEDKIKGPWNWAVNFNLGPCFRKIANDAFHGTAGGPNKLGTF